MAGARAAEVALVCEWHAPFCVDVRLTLSVHGRGRSDPTFRIDETGAVWRTSLTPDGPGTIRAAGRLIDDPPAGTGVVAQAVSRHSDQAMSNLHVGHAFCQFFKRMGSGKRFAIIAVTDLA